MGQHKWTAFACSDWNLAKRDLLDDLVEGWDSYADMANGASEVDRSNAKAALNALSREWDCLDMPEDALEEFADEYEAALRATYLAYTAVCEEWKKVSSFFSASEIEELLEVQ